MTNLNRHLVLAEPVRAALEAGRAVLALESTILAHGMPWPKNLETARWAEQAARDAGATPATIAILDGQLRVGLADAQLEQLARLGPGAVKCSRRDIPFLLREGGNGATTVAATVIVAALAGIRVLATGGIGGVHRGAETSMDVSADLEELARTRVAVVCAGPKSILDLGLTLEYLETQGVPVIGYRTDELPAFYTRESGFGVDYRLDSAAEIATVLETKWALGLDGGVVVANPIPGIAALEYENMEHFIARALVDAREARVSGKALTPWLLQRVEELSGGESLVANVELMLNNARLGAEIAVALAGADG